MNTLNIILQIAQQKVEHLDRSNDFSFIGLLVDVVIIGLVISLIIRYVKKRRNKNAQKAKTNQISSDQLMKLKELLDQGVITQQEFDEKKKQILNL